MKSENNKRDWSQIKQNLKKSNSNITDEDFNFADAEKADEQIINNLQKKTGKSRVEIEDLINKIQ